MSLTMDQITELWKQRLFILRVRKLFWIESTFFFPYILILMPIAGSGFQKPVVLYCSIASGISLIYTITVYLMLRSIKKHRFRGLIAYPKTILLYNMYDLFQLMFIGMIFWMTGVLMIGSSKIIPAILLCQLFVYILGVLTSRGFVKFRIRKSNQPNKSYRYLPLALAISSVLPGMGVLAGTLSSRSGKNMDVIMEILSIGLGSLLTYLSTLGIGEIVTIGLQKWPHIRRENSQYSVEWPVPSPE